MKYVASFVDLVLDHYRFYKTKGIDPVSVKAEHDQLKASNTLNDYYTGLPKLIAMLKDPHIRIEQPGQDRDPKDQLVRFYNVNSQIRVAAVSR